MREHDVAQLGKMTELNSWAVCDLFILKKVETASSVLNPLDCLERKKTSGFSSFQWVVYLQCPPVRPWRLFHGQAPVRLEPHLSW